MNKLFQFALVFFFLMLLPVVAHATPCLNSPYTAFNETWSSGGDPAWSGESGNNGCQTAFISAGANPTVTASTGCTGTWDDANQIKLAGAATAAELDEYGTIPYISSATKFHIYFEFCYSSTTVPGFAHFFDLKYGGAGTSAYFLQYNSSGSGAIYVNSGATSCAVSTGARHTFDITSDGAHISTKIDGTTCGTTMAVVADAMQLTFKGTSSTSDANVFIGHVGIDPNGSGLAGGWPPSMLTDLNGASAGTPTTSNMNAGTRCPIIGANFEGWSYSAGAGGDTMALVSSPLIAFPASLTVCGTAYPGNVALSFQHSVGLAVVSPSASVSLNFSTTYASWAVGFYYQFTSTATTVSFVDQARIGANGTAFHICGGTGSTGCTGTPGYVTGAVYNLCIENNAGTSIICVQPSSATWYWVSALHSSTASTGGDTINIYNVNQSTGALGSLVLNQAVTNGNEAPGGQTLILGAVGSEAPGVNFTSTYQNIVVQAADQAFPVLPPAAPPSGFPIIIGSVRYAR